MLSQTYLYPSYLTYFSPGDVSAMTPGGIRMGTPALTSRCVFRALYYSLTVIFLQLYFAQLLYCLRRGLTEEDFEKVAHFFDRAVTITESINAKTGPKVRLLLSILNPPYAIALDCLQLSTCCIVSSILPFVPSLLFPPLM